MRQISIGIILGILWAATTSDEPSLGGCVFSAVAGVILVKVFCAVAGDKTSMLMSWGLCYVFGVWIFNFIALPSHVVYDPYVERSWEEFLEMPWGPAWGKKTAEDVIPEMSSTETKMYRTMYESGKRNDARVKTSVERYVQKLPFWKQTAAYVHRAFTVTAETIGAPLTPNFVHEWVTSPTKDWDRLSHYLFQPSILRFRFFCFTAVGVILSPLLVLLWTFHKRPSEHDTVTELMLSSAGLVRIVAFFMLLTFAAIIPLLTLFIGPYYTLIPFLFAPISAVLLYYSTLKGRELV